jgi:hypothetical protein
VHVTLVLSLGELGLTETPLLRCLISWSKAKLKLYFMSLCWLTDIDRV